MSTIFKTILLAMCMATTVASMAAKDFKKEFTESYDVNDGAKVELFNKYGNMSISTISSDKVNIRVEIIVDARNEEKADDVFERIDIDFSGSSNHVKVETKIGENSGGFWKRWNSSGNYQIHYYVEVPTHVYLNLRNKYGNISAEDMDNDVDIELKYGNFDIGNAHDMDIILGYGNGEMSSVNDLDINLKYGKIRAEKADNVDIESKYSQITIDQALNIDSESKYDTYKMENAKSLDNEGKYDNFRIGQIDDLDIDSKYTGIDIERLGVSADINTAYGEIRIDEITERLDHINIESSYTGIRIYNPEEVGFEFDVDTKYAGISIDEGTGEFGDDDNEHWARGKRKGKGNGKIKINARYGSVKIR